MAAFTTIAAGVGAALSVGSAAKGISDASKAEKKAKKSSKAASTASAEATAALARAEAQSIVPGFGNSGHIPGYHRSLSPSISGGGSQVGMALGDDWDRMSQGGTRKRGKGGDFIDVLHGPGVGVGSEIKFDEAGNMIFNREAIIQSVQKNLKNNKQLQKVWNQHTANLPTGPTGLPVLPDPNTADGKAFYASLPKSILEMATDPTLAQMYKGSNIVNPYANVQDLSRIAEDVSGMVKDRTDLLTDRTDIIQDRTGLLRDRTEDFTDVSGTLKDLSDQEDLSGRITDLRPGAQDFSGLGADTSILASNPYAQLQVATQAADLQAQQSDQALANTLSTIRVTGAGAGGATAIAQAALQSKLGIAATIEQQEAKNTELRAAGQQQIETIKMSESQRLQNLALSERLRLEGLRQSEGLRIDQTRLTEGQALRGLKVSEGQRLQAGQLSERLRGQGLTLEESLRLQQADFDTAREQDRIKFEETGRLEESRYGEAGRIQEAQMTEALRIQQLKFEEQQRLQQADTLAREYQFRAAETREQNRLNRLANQETQAVQTAADLEAAKVSASAAKSAAWTTGLSNVASAGMNLAGSGAFKKKTNVIKVNPRRIKKSNITPGGVDYNYTPTLDPDDLIAGIIDS